MPSSIPYDHPSLVLGNIINPALLSKLRQINSLQVRIDTAQDKMQSYISMKRSLGMTISELLNMNVDISALTEKMGDIDIAIVKAATDYSAIRLSNETEIQALREQIGEDEADETIESPIDYLATGLQRLPYAADSLKLDAQYFSYEEDQAGQPSGALASIGEYIKEATGDLGGKASTDISRAATAQVSLQQKNHDLTGTLVITASCTHKQALFLSPLVIDADKAISVWNSLHPEEASRLDLSDVTALRQIAEEESSSGQAFLSLLSGATYGSSFVGMVHVLRQEASGGGGRPLTSIAGELQERLTIGNWLEEAAGGLGIDPSMAEDIRSLLNTQRITSHITLVAMGCVPSVRSNLVGMGIKTLSVADPEKMKANLSLLNNVTSGEKATVDRSAAAARTGGKLAALQGSAVQSVMNGLGRIDQSNNKSMDINSLMTAFEDYLEEVRKGNSGVPINFYVKKISRGELAKLWLDKYHPAKEGEAPEEKTGAGSGGKEAPGSGTNVSRTT